MRSGAPGASCSPSCTSSRICLMPDAPSRASAWRLALRTCSERRGIMLPPDVLEELVTHLEDVYDAVRHDGGSDDEAGALVERLIERGSYEELAPMRRVRSRASTLEAPVSAANSDDDSRVAGRGRERDPDRNGGGGLGQHFAWLADLAFHVRYAFRGMHRRP